MGSFNTCKGQIIENQWFYQSIQCTQSTDISDIGLLNNKEKQMWQHQLHLNFIPHQQFYKKSQAYKHQCFKQIKKDVMRTFPDAVFFGIKQNLNRFQKLLQSFAIYFPRIGYTQGINFLAGYLLICGFTDNLAFSLLIQITLHDKLLAIGLYEDQFPLNRLYCEIFWKLLYKKMPKVAQKLKKLNIPDQVWIFQWFISFFLYTFPLDYVKGFWNFIITKKQFALVTIALGIVKCIKNDLMKLSEDDEWQYFQYIDSLKTVQMCHKVLDIKKIITFASSITKKQIDLALEETTCVNNPYRKYFLSNQQKQKQMWSLIFAKTQSDRKQFTMHPESDIYVRNRKAADHLEKYVIQKFQQYKSDMRKSSATFRNSTFSLCTQFKYLHNSGKFIPQLHNLGKKTVSIVQYEK